MWQEFRVEGGAWKQAKLRTWILFALLGLNKKDTIRSGPEVLPMFLVLVLLLLCLQ